MTHTHAVAPADVLLITVTHEETQAILEAVEQLCSPREFRSEHTTRGGYIRLGAIGDAQVVLTKARMGDAGAGNAQDTVTAGVIDYQPAAVIAVGIAYGVDPVRQRIGDILLADRLFLWGDNRVDEAEDGKPTIRVRGEEPASSARLFSVFSAYAELWNRQSIGDGRVHQGTFASGGTLINYAAFRDWLRQQTTNMIGGEMEGRGVYGATEGRAVGAARADWIVVKGICDWAAEKNVPTKDEDQRLAARNAARFVISVLSQGGFAVGSATPGGALSIAAKLRRESRAQRLADLREEHAAVAARLRSMLNPADAVKLERRLKDLEQEIERVQRDLDGQ